MRDAPGGRRPLGHSALTVPRVALGCGNFGGVGSACELFGQGLNQDQAFALMDAAWETGIGPGRPEHLAPVTEALERPLTAQERAEVGAVMP